MSSSAVCSSEIDDIITQKQAPAGIVFEIVSDEDGLLGELLPSVKADIEELRQRFPDLPIAIVSHGKELFALTIKNSSSELSTHDLVKQLVKAEDVDVHVCGTHAGWYDVTAEAFPDYVDVTAAAPAQIDDYEAIGYTVIILTD
jgi:intracellular sulfur oxidation DsrE/DsrF family protein